MHLAFMAKLKLLAELTLDEVMKKLSCAALGEVMKKLSCAAKLRSGEAISLAVGDYPPAVISKS